MTKPAQNSGRKTRGLPLDGVTFEIAKGAGFEAAHKLDPSEDGHPYGRVHGHSFRIDIAVLGTAGSGDDWVVDLADLDAALSRVTALLDHSMLNDIPGLELPTLERLCMFIASRLLPDLPGLHTVKVSRPSLSESCSITL